MQGPWGLSQGRAGLGSPFFPLSPSFLCSAEVQKCGGWGLKAQTLVRDATSHPALETRLVPYQHDLRQGAFSALGWCGLTVVMPWAKCYAHTGGAAVTACQRQRTEQVAPGLLESRLFARLSPACSHDSLDCICSLIPSQECTAPQL